MTNNHEFIVNTSPDPSDYSDISLWDDLLDTPFADSTKDVPESPDTSKEHDETRLTSAINIRDPRSDFLTGGEITAGRTPDSITRLAAPLDIPGARPYSEVMRMSPDYSEPLETRFHLDPDDYPIFSRQAELSGTLQRHTDRTLSVPETANYYITDTIETIDRLQDTDMVLYLDKSARPVSWLVNEFWEEFSDEPRPAEAFLAIDRLQWFPRAHVEVNANGETADPITGLMRKATFEDFEKGSHFIPQETIARIRALFIPGGVETDDPDTIMSTPTGLDGKHLTIIDEVRNSGSTIQIAQWLIKKALPELASTDMHTFWHLPDLISEGTDGTIQMNHAPVWYDPEKHDSWSGRGVLDINEGYFEENYQNSPDPYSRAQMLGSHVLGEPLDVTEEPGGSSLELQREIRSLHEEYRRGHVLPSFPRGISEETEDRLEARLRNFGIQFGPLTGNKSVDAHKFATLRNNLKNL